MITDIYCFGSSYTAGGGYEFDSNWFDEITSENIKSWKEYLDNQTETPKTNWNYSWPGQLQKLLNNDIKVHNLAKQGYGNQRTLRKVYELINSKEFKKETSLLLFEFTWLARDEIYSNHLKKYLVHNYSIEDDKFIKGYLAQSHHYDDSEIYQYLNSDKIWNTVNDYYKLFWNGHDQDIKMTRELEYLMGFLETIGIKWYQVESTIQYKHITPSKINRDFEIKFDGDRSFYNFAINNNLTIEQETAGLVKDTHISLKGNKIISKIIFDFLIKNNIIQKKTLF